MARARVERVEPSGDEATGSGRQSGQSELFETVPAYIALERPRLPRTLRAIRGPEDVEDICRGLLRRRFEEFHSLQLNARHEVQRRVLVSRGEMGLQPSLHLSPKELQVSIDGRFAQNSPSKMYDLELFRGKVQAWLKT